MRLEELKKREKELKKAHETISEQIKQLSEQIKQLLDHRIRIAGAIDENLYIQKNLVEPEINREK